MSLLKGKITTCKRSECNIRRSNHQPVSYCSDMCNLKDLQEENTLLTTKLKGLEDLDEDKANLRDIAQRAIWLLNAYDLSEGDKLQKYLDEELG